MKPTDQQDAALFRAPADSAVPEREIAAADSSAEAMTRLRDPFAVDGDAHRTDVCR
jgi:hypothetical protein